MPPKVPVPAVFLTWTGVALLLPPAPRPSCEPLKLSPHPQTVPSSRRAITWPQPAPTCTTFFVGDVVAPGVPGIGTLRGWSEHGFAEPFAVQVSKAGTGEAPSPKRL